MFQQLLWHCLVPNCMPLPLLWDHQQCGEEGLPCLAPWRGHSSFASWCRNNMGSSSLPVISYSSIGIKHSTRGSFWWLEKSLALIGQLPATPSKHCLPSPMCAWGIGKFQQADCKICTRQVSNKIKHQTKEASSQTWKLKCTYNDNRIIRRSPKY